MKKVIWFLSLMSLVAGFQQAMAAPVNAQLSWVAPTSREDGTHLLPTDIAGYRVYQAIGTAVSNDPESKHIVVASGTSQRIELELVPRPEPYELRFGVRTVDKKGLISKLSETFTLTVLVESTSPPSFPTGVTVEINCDKGCVITTVK